MEQEESDSITDEDGFPQFSYRFITLVSSLESKRYC